MKISIIIPNYKKIDFLQDCLNSVISQLNINDIDIVAVDDGSSLEVSKKIEVSLRGSGVRYKFIKNEKNMGLAHALNRAICSAEGELIARIDNDDVWIDPNKLSKQINFLKNYPEYVLIGTNYAYGKDLASGTPSLTEELSDSKIRKVLLHKNVFCHSSVIFTKNVWEKIGGYNEKLKYTEDHDLWIRMSLLGKVFILSDVSVFYRTGEGLSKNTNHLLKSFYKARIFIKYGKHFKNKLYSALKIFSDITMIYKIKKLFK